MSDKLEKVNDLIEELQSEINQPIWSEDQREGLIEAQSAVGEVKNSLSSAQTSGIAKAALITPSLKSDFRFS